MKKLFSTLIVFLIIFCFFACKDKVNAEYSYLPETVLCTQKNSSGFSRDLIIEYVYDGYGNVIKQTQYIKGKIFNLRDEQYDIKYTYNENGDILQEHIRTEYFSTSITDGHNVFEEGYNYIYNEKQQLIKKEPINPNLFLGYEYEYDERGNLVKEYKYFDDGTRQLEFEYEYDVSNKLIKKREMSNYSNLTSIWVETEYTYDLRGNLIYSMTVSYDYFGSISHYAELKCYYDEFDRLIKEENSFINLDGEITDQEIREYKSFTEFK